MKKDKFAHKAKNYEQESRRIKTAKAIADKIKENINLNKTMHLIDFGSGTGLLLEEILPLVGKITAIDISPSMTQVLKNKNLKNVEILNIDLTKRDLNIKVDGIISSMTMHHIKDLGALFGKLHALLKPGGFIAIADLAPEDGTFHDHGNEGVHHFGFSKEALESIAKNAGFGQLDYTLCHTVKKEGGRVYDIFLLTAGR